MLESALEKNVCACIKRCGGKAHKWGQNGKPDRICFLPGGKVVLIELKRPSRENGLSPRQEKEISVLRGLGATVWVINNMEDLRCNLRGLGYEV